MLTGRKKNAASGSYEIFNQPFSQFFRTDIDLRHSFPVNNTDNIVGRVFGGLVIPYKNSKIVPIERQYFSGGSNGIRAWNPYKLGPGAYYDGALNYQTGDIKLEANLEYRYKLFWILESAIFVDAGNVWTYKDTSRANGKFMATEFLEQIGCGNMGLVCGSIFLFLSLGSITA
ncbi:MAG: BamA/TamA family outer membrane protein [Bacteroidales bacterium]|nr:BamA/TamA family outer membrane protein [Bacteroidales bacterium]